MEQAPDNLPACDAEPLTVLVADDSPVSRAMLARLLRSWGYNVVAVADGKQAHRALMAPNGPKLAILDWIMPGMDGVELCKKLREEGGDRHVFVYLLTMKASNEDLVEGLSAGADDYLIKPIHAPELQMRLRNGERLVRLHDQLIRTREALRDQAMRDPLTNVFNRRAFFDIAKQEVSRARRYGYPLSVLMIDLDRFKGINDTYGHPVGDEMLVEAAKRMADSLRDSDHLGRYGGEEFVVLLPECQCQGALTVADRIRDALRDSAVETAVGPLRITASVGAATSFDHDEDLEELLDQADQALYEAKEGGRDRTVYFEEPAPCVALG